MIHATMWMNPEDIILSEISQTSKDKNYDCTHVKFPYLSNSETESRTVGRVWGRGTEG